MANVAEGGGGKSYSKGMASSEIQTLQVQLNLIGFNCGPANGIYNSRTVAAVQSYQASHGLNVTGEANVATLDRISNDYYDQLSRNNSPTMVSGPNSKKSGSSSGSGSISTSYTSGSDDQSFALGDAAFVLSPNGPLIFSGEYTLDEIQSALNSSYKGAPPLIKARAGKVRNLVDSSLVKMKEMYITETLDAVSSSYKNFNPEDSVGYLNEKPNMSPEGSPDKNVVKPNMDRWPTVIQYGDSGDYVIQLQQILIGLGYNPGPVNGHFGRMTKSAVIAFQGHNYLELDGKVGPKTRAALKAKSK